jgi:hypothetical protein
MAWVLPALLLGLATSAGALDRSRTGAAVAFARINGGTGAVKAFGGKGTTAAIGGAALRTCPTGDSSYEVTFTGRYPDPISADQIIINSTSDWGLWGVTNARVISASPTTIVVGVSEWRSNDQFCLDNDLFVSVYIGRTQ